MRLLTSVFAGALLAIAVGVLAYALGPFVDAVGVYASPARLLLPIIGPLIPSSILYQLAPEGGAPGSVLLIMSSAFFFWTVMFGVGHFAITSVKRKRAM